MWRLGRYKGVILLPGTSLLRSDFISSFQSPRESLFDLIFPTLTASNWPASVYFHLENTFSVQEDMGVCRDWGVGGRAAVIVCIECKCLFYSLFKVDYYSPNFSFSPTWSACRLSVLHVFCKAIQGSHLLVRGFWRSVYGSRSGLGIVVLVFTCSGVLKPSEAANKPSPS